MREFGRKVRFTVEEKLGMSLERDQILKVEFAGSQGAPEMSYPFPGKGISQIHIAQQIAEERIDPLEKAEDTLTEATSGEALLQGTHHRSAREAAQRITLRVRRELVNGDFEGSHPIASVSKSKGVERHGHRPYQPGDDTSDIDWKAYGKTDKLYLKESSSEHQLTVMVIVDVSRQNLPTAAEVFAVLGYTVAKEADRLGFMIRKEGEQYFEPSSKKGYVEFGIEQILGSTQKGERLKIHQALDFLSHELTGRALVFFISDQPSFAANTPIGIPPKYELAAITIKRMQDEKVEENDPGETPLPTYLSVFNDPGSGEDRVLEFSQRRHKLEQNISQSL